MSGRGSSAWRVDAWGEPCAARRVSVPIYEGGPTIVVDARAVDAFEALGAVFVARGYVVRRAGCYNCRHITGGTSMSAHAWGIAVDVNDDTNPYRLDRLVTDMPASLIQAAYAIRTVDGVPVFRWGGDWDGRPDTPQSNYDSMHFEIVAAPGELAAGLPAALPPTHRQPPGRVGPRYTPTAYPTLRRGSVGPAVAALQRLIRLGNTTGQGIFGPRTEAGVRLYQARHGLVEDGIVGPATWTALLSDQPTIASGAPSPQKHIAA